jgi:hypothetical protein
MYMCILSIIVHLSNVYLVLVAELMSRRSGGHRGSRNSGARAAERVFFTASRRSDTGINAEAVDSLVATAAVTTRAITNTNIVAAGATSSASNSSSSISSVGTAVHQTARDIAPLRARVLSSSANRIVTLAERTRHVAQGFSTAWFILPEQLLEDYQCGMYVLHSMGYSYYYHLITIGICREVLCQAVEPKSRSTAATSGSMSTISNITPLMRSY